MSKDIEILPRLVSSWQPASKNWSVTYASRFIQEMERRYGERDRRWTYTGVEFRDDVPYVWFPGNGEIPPRMHIAISLGRENAVYQLAHECVHLLAPVVGGGAPVIEEGLPRYLPRICSGTGVITPITGFYAGSTVYCGGGQPPSATRH